MSVERGTIVTIEEAAALLAAARAAGETVVMAHGCFDVLHPGHVRHLQEARRLGDRLLVTVTGDAAMRKGVGRPLIPQDLRAEHLAALACVDWVAITPEPTAVATLDRLRPDVYVKGREYETNRDPRFLEEKALVESGGGRVVFTSGDVVMSSTAIVDAMTAPSDARIAGLLTRERGGRSADAWVEAMAGARVAVIGETIIDTYVQCERARVTDEGPMLTLSPRDEVRSDGGAAIVARHLAAMGARPVLLTPLPATPDAHALSLRLEIEGVEVRGVACDGPIPEKRRFLVGPSKVMKLDIGSTLVLDAATREAAVRDASGLARAVDAVVIVDYGHGFLSASMITELCHATRRHVPVLAGDVSGPRSSLLAMREMDLLAPSELELRSALNDHGDGLAAVAARLLEQTSSRAVVVTMGADGLIVFEHRDDAPPNSSAWGGRLRAEPVPALLTHAVDPLGCGDALLAAATLTLVAGGSVGLAAAIGAVAAAAETRRLGNVVVDATDLRHGLARFERFAEPTTV